MNQSWFYVSGDQPVGPVSLEELRAASAVGLVGPETLVRDGASANWYLAGQIPGLLAGNGNAQGPGSAIGIGPPAVDTAVAYAPTPSPVATCAPPVAFPAMPAPPVAPPADPTAAYAPPFAPPGVLAPPVAPPAAAFAPPVAPPPIVDNAPPVIATDAYVAGTSPISQPSRRSRSVLGAIVTMFGGVLVGGLVAGGAWVVWNLPSPGKAKVSRSAGPGSGAKAEQTAEASKPATSEEPATDDKAAKKPNWPGWSSATEGGVVAGSLYEGAGDQSPSTKLDELVLAKLKELGLTPAAPSSDGVFLRRVYLDVIGTLPTAEEARQFLLDKSPNKRRVLIDRLMERDEYADYWAMRWSDILRIKAEFPINLWPNAAQAYHRWVHTCLRENVSYDKFVREMLTACGSNFRVGPVNFYRAMQSKKPAAIAKAVALTFMGVRTDNWPKERLDGMATFFSMIGYKGTAEWKEEIILFDPSKARPQAPKASESPKGKPSPKPADEEASAEVESIVGTFPDGTKAELTADKDPREVFADWLIDAKNPWFARHFVNRLWYWLLGRGIVQEPDDFRPDNPPQNPALLDYLAEELVNSKYDIKHLVRMILNSKTYQLSCVARSKGEQSAANFGHYALRRLDAEVLIDAVCQITGTTEQYNSLIPEPFTWIPENHRTITLPDGSITSSFLELFGRPPRDTGMESERNNRITPGQCLHLLNSTHILKKFQQGPKFRNLIRSNQGDPEKLIETLYLTILSRFPSEQEAGTVRSYSADDIGWALVNTAEFIYRH
jgi:hypothetical protein